MAKSKGTSFRRTFTHWRSGKKYDARDYGRLPEVLHEICETHLSRH